MLAVEDDLEEYWGDLLPGRFRHSLAHLVKRPPAFVSVSTRDPDNLNRVRDLLVAQRALRINGSVFETPLETLQHVLELCGGRGNVLTRLLKAVRENSRVRCRSIAKGLWSDKNLASFLEAAHSSVDTDAIVSSALSAWLDGNEYRWDPEECDLLGDRPNEEPVRNLFFLQMRLLHLLLVGGAYGLFKPLVVVLPNIEQWVRTDILSSNDRRARACQLDSLLDEIDHWNRNFANCLTVVLGWSGLPDDAVLLRGLCEPLMQKIEASKAF